MNLKHKKRMVFAAAALLLICTVLLIASSFAWIALSRAPEISGISTNVGANGSLEIALLSSETYIDPSRITTKIGGSLENADATVANLQWGSVLDLSDASYGLHDVTLIPARLQVNQSNVVGSGLLSIPDYGLDGRFSGFSNNTASGTYLENEYGETSFSFTADTASFGVRGIGSIVGVSPQQAALSNARVAIQANQYAAMNAMIALWEENGGDLMLVMEYIYGNGEKPTDDFTAEVFLDTAMDMLTILNYLDTGLRHSVIGYASVMLDDEAQFEMVEEAFLNKDIPLSILVGNLPVELPELYTEAVTNLETDMSNMYWVLEQCAVYEYSGSFKVTLGSMLCKFLNEDCVYLNGWRLKSFLIDEDNELTVLSTSDIGPAMHTVGRYVGEFSAFCQYDGKSVEFVAFNDTNMDPILVYTCNILDALDNTNDEDYVDVVSLSDVYGFAVDMAFRCNTASDLLLQTSGTAEVAGDSAYLDNQGAGSYMRFNSEQMSERQILSLMDAIRIGFLDNQNNLLGVAKLNTSNYESAKNGITVPLYLYEYTVQADGSIITGERRNENNMIMSLQEDMPTVISAVVWLDGDYVDNSLAAIRDQSMNGVLNLQFASSADLNPAFTDEPEETQPEGTEAEVPDARDQEDTMPTEQMGTEPTDPVETFPAELTQSISFDSYEDGSYSYFVVDSSGYRFFEIFFEGICDESEYAITINSITSFSDHFVYVPSVVIDSTTGTTYNISIVPDTLFANLESCPRSISFTSPDSSKVRVIGDSLANLLNGCKNIIRFDGFGLDTSDISDMTGLFSECTDLEVVEIEYWDTSNVKYMGEMFSGCSSLVALNLSGWDTSNVQHMTSMFADCSRLAQLDIGEWDTSGVTEMNYMFYRCRCLTTLEVGEWKTASVTNMRSMFQSCSALTELPIAAWDVSNVMDMDSMFRNCINLTGLDVSSWDFRNAYTNGMFYNCPAGEDLN